MTQRDARRPCDTKEPRSRRLPHSRLPLLLTGCIAISGCMVGPNYERPGAPVPAAFKEPPPAPSSAASDATWKPAEPGDAAARGEWWKAFHDAALDALEAQVMLSNQNLIAYEAQFRQARASVLGARSNYLPTIAASPSFTRARNSQNSGLGTAGKTLNTFDLPATVSYEVDIWGAVRRSVEASEGAAQASFALLENARLSYQSLLAQDYFLLRGLDAQKRILESTMESYTKYLDLTKERYKGGVDSQADVAQAETQLDGARVQLIDVGILRSQYEHALAVLVGKAPADLSVTDALSTSDATATSGVPPPVPAGVPSSLLERRPDIASAERLVSEANAEIGIAKAAYYPSITLGSTGGGLESASSGSWLLWPSRFWSLGPTVSEVLFDGGKRKAQLAQAKAGYDSAVALYRQTVLGAFQQVEDALSNLRILEEESKAEDDAVRSAEKSLSISTEQYKQGIQSYLQVITAQTIALNDELNAVKIHTSRMTSSVLLIEALGGGWTNARIPTGRSLAGSP